MAIFAYVCLELATVAVLGHISRGGRFFLRVERQFIGAWQTVFVVSIRHIIVHMFYGSGLDALLTERQY